MQLIHGFSINEFEVIVARKYMNKVDSCKQRGVSFELTIAQFRHLLTKKRCAYTGIAMTMHTGAGNSPINSDLTIERIDNSKGYSVDNCITVCSAANGIKSAFEDPKTFLNIQDAIRMFSNLDKIQQKAKAA